jgi:hypothetical protein
VQLPIRAIPTQVRRRRSGCEVDAEESQSLRTDQGNSDSNSTGLWAVTAPKESRNPSVPIRAIPTDAKMAEALWEEEGHLSQSLRTDQGNSDVL